MNRDGDESKVGWGQEDRRTVDETPPPEHAGPLWMNPKFVFPALAVIAAAIAISIVIRDDPTEPGDDPAQSAVSTSSTTAGTSTTAATTTTTPADPLDGGGAAVDDFGGSVGLTPDELARLIDGMIPYDGTWYPSGDKAQPAEHGPGITHVVPARIEVPAGATGLLAGVTPGVYDLALILFDRPPEFAGVPDSGNQVSVGIACVAMPERSGGAGFGAPGWDLIQDFGGRGYSDRAGDLSIPDSGGFAVTSGNLVVIGIPTTDCPYRAIANFFRETGGAEATPADPAEYQFFDLEAWQTEVVDLVGGA